MNFIIGILILISVIPNFTGIIETLSETFDKD